MKKTIKLLAILICIAFANSGLNAQCTAFAGPSQTFCCGAAVVSLTSAINTTSAACTCTNFAYAWTPTTGLNNPTISNPTATITTNITYTVCITAFTGSNCSVCCSACKTVSFHYTPGCCRITGLNEATAGNSFINMYPNPVKEDLTIEINEDLNKAELKMYDVSGKIVWKKENVSGKNKFNINVSTFPKGIYFIKATENDKEIYTNKVVLE